MGGITWWGYGNYETQILTGGGGGDYIMTEGDGGGGGGGVTL